MSREGTGEESRKQILNVATKLFSEKGYDNTTINDIVNELGGMTKGVVYHHFKSKQDIFEQVLESYSDNTKLVEVQGESGLEKIQSLLLSELLNLDKQSIGYSGKVILRTPRMIGEQYRITFEELAPQIKIFVLEGIKDGSIQTDYPQEISELIMITFNLWLGIQLAEYSVDEAIRKLNFFQFIFKKAGVDLINQEIMDASINLIKHLKK